MSDDLDVILTEQLHFAQTRKKLVKKLRKLMPSDPNLVLMDNKIDMTIIFLETMINDKKIKPKPRINIKRKLFRIYIHFKFICLSIIIRKKNK